MNNLIEEAKKFLKDEENAAAIYEELSKIEKKQENKEKLEGISQMEKRHAEFWKKFLESRGIKLEIKISRLQIKYYKILRKIIGTSYIYSLMELAEKNAAEAYYDFYKSEELKEEERRSISRIIVDELEHERYFFKGKELFRKSNIRDFIMGMNDRLVEILGVVTGLSAVYINNPFLVAISGIIVGVAGSLSMAIGTFISVRSQRQVNSMEKRRLEIMFNVSKEKAKEELYNKFKEAGLTEETAKEVTSQISKEKDAATKILVEEYDENEIMAAIYTGIAYIIGVMFPVTPYLLTSSSLIALPFSITFAGLTLAVVAALIANTSNIPIKKKVIEMVVTGLGAAASYIFGNIIQTLSGIT